MSGPTAKLLISPRFCHGVTFQASACYEHRMAMAESVPAVPNPAEIEGAIQRARQGRKLWRLLGFLAIAAALLGGVGWWWRGRTRVSTERYITATMTAGDVVETVQSTGQVKPLTEVQVGAQVSGRVTAVHVDFNSLVHRGDVLAEIDPALIGSQVEAIGAQIGAARAAVARAKANMATSEATAKRIRNLASEGVASKAELDNAEGALLVAKSEIAATEAQVSQLEAQLRSSKTNLAYTKVYSPIDGIVINRGVDPGQTVAASFQTPTLFVIAENLTKMRVFADIDEADVGKLKESMDAEVAVDAFPNERFAGKVNQLRYNPFNVSGVVTYAAVIEVANPDLKLRPGMTATVTIRTSEAKATTRIPNAAIRYKPTPPKDGPPPERLPTVEPGKARIYVLSEQEKGKETAEARIIDIGISDGSYTVTKTDLSNLKIIIDESDESPSMKGRGPRMF